MVRNAAPTATSKNSPVIAGDIEKWAAAWNDNPTPFVWHRTADQILEHLAGYCPAINKNSSEPS